MVNGSAVLSLVIAGGCRYLGLGIVTAWVEYVGLLGMALAALWREWSVLTVGAFFSNVVEIEQGHQRITTGLYRWLRHPVYTGLLVFFTAAALALGTWIGAVIAFVLILLALRYRIGIEERLLAETFGSAYQAYELCNKVSKELTSPLPETRLPVRMLLLLLIISLAPGVDS